VGVAFEGGGVWSLVAQAAVVDVVGLAFAWSTFAWRPRLMFSWRRLKPVLAFSVGIMGSQLLWLVMARMPELIIGRTRGVVAVGVYRVAYRIIDFVGQAVLQPVSSVALVTLARLQDQPQRFNSAYMRIVGVVGLATFPVLFGLGAAAPDAVHVLFGGKWDASAPVSTVLSLIALPLTLNYFVAPALSAKGESRIVLQLSALQVVATAALMLAAAPFGLMAVAAAFVARLYLTMPVSQWALHRRAGIPVLSAVRALAAPLAASVLMCAAVVGVRTALGGAEVAPIARLACQVAAGAVVYILTLAVIARPVLADHAEVALRMVRRAAPGAPRFAGGSRGS
jgi:O-antigen/teichoic acid export membrane protein